MKPPTIPAIRTTTRTIRIITRPFPFFSGTIGAGATASIASSRPSLLTACVRLDRDFAFLGLAFLREGAWRRGAAVRGAGAGAAAGATGAGAGAGAPPGP